MFKKILIITVLFASFLPLVSLAVTKNLEYAVWIPYWKKTAASAETINNLSKLSIISPFSYEVNTDGTIKNAMKIDQAPWPDLLSSAKKQKVRIVPSILWTNGTAINKILSTTKTRDAHINEIVKLVTVNNFDGIDIDYENKKAETLDNFSLFITGLSKKLHANKKILICTIEPRTPPTSQYVKLPEEIKYANDYKVLNKYCDEVRIMAYDQTTIDVKLNMKKRAGGLYAPVADKDWVKKVITYAGNDISRSKIVLGVANYGYEYKITDKKTYYDYTQLRSLSYKGATDLAKSLGVKVQRTSSNELAFTYIKNGEVRLVWFSDSQAIADKIAMAKQYGLKGVALFRVDGESDANLWSVFK